MGNAGKNILQYHGWVMFGVSNSILIFSFRMLEIYTCIKTDSEINNKNQLQAHSIFKHNFDVEKKLNLETDPKCKSTLTSFRTSSHILMIGRGRCKMHREGNGFVSSVICIKLKTNITSYWFVQIIGI